MQTSPQVDCPLAASSFGPGLICRTRLGTRPTLSRNRRCPTTPDNVWLCVGGLPEGATRICQIRKVSDYLPPFLPEQENFHPGLETPHVHHQLHDHQCLDYRAQSSALVHPWWQNHELPWSHLYTLQIINIYKWELLQQTNFIRRTEVLYKIQEIRATKSPKDREQG